MTYLLLVLFVFAMSGAGAIFAGPIGWICGCLLGIFCILMGTVPGGLMAGVLLLITAGVAITGYYELQENKAKDAKKDLEKERNLQKNLLGNLHKYTLQSIHFRWEDWKNSVERGDTLDEIRHYKSGYLKTVAGVITVLERMKDEQRIVFWNWIFKTALFDIPIEDYPHTEKFWDEEVLSEYLPEWTEELMV